MMGEEERERRESKKWDKNDSGEKEREKGK